MFKSGFISIIGRPNVGKSTLLNALVNQKVAITSQKAQTTRNNIQGILTTEDYQMVFIDTPGIHKPHHQLGQFMNKSAFTMLNDNDLILFLAPANEPIGKGDLYIIEKLKTTNTPVVLVISKIDQVTKDVLHEKISEWMVLFDFVETIPISALKLDNIEVLKSVVSQYLSEGPKYFPEGQVSNYDEQFLVTEFIREKVLFLTEDEIPHSVAVVVDKMEINQEEGTMDIIASIIVERKSQKGIVIGKQASMIKKIRQLAQRDIRQLLGMPVYLELFVKDEKDWRNKQKYLNAFGYRQEDI